VVTEIKRGYGNACLAGLRYLKHNPPKNVVFADCDGTLNPVEIKSLLSPIESDKADIVLGRRSRVETGAMPSHQLYGNKITCFLLKVLYRLTISDIPPYRAVSWSFLTQLPLSEGTYGFPIETVVLAARKGGRFVEVEVDYRVRTGGKSKVAGSMLGSLQAGLTMIGLAILIRFRSPDA
jgi:hypothetical protein